MNLSNCQLALALLGVLSLPAAAQDVSSAERKALEAKWHIKHFGGRVAEVEGKVFSVHVWKKELSGTDLKAICHFKELKILELLGVKIDDDSSLENIKVLTDLEQLYLSLTPVSDADLEHVSALTKLTHLKLRATDITNLGLKHLAGLTKLELLDLSATQITDRGLKHLAGLSNLEALHLRDTKVSIEGLEHLKELKKLTHLYLSDKQITSTGVRHLQALVGLKALGIDGRGITDDEFAALKKSLPNVRIFSTSPWLRRYRETKQ